jgi:hypothetical protein
LEAVPVTLTEAWRELHRSRFPELPLDCGNLHDPGIIYSEDLRDWSDKATTPDQARMERYVDRYDLRHARVLHVGIGNSGFARRFYGRVKAIVGTTIDEPEREVARSLALPNYTFVLHNKFAGKDDAVEGTFDFIFDNNPTSPCCCLRHLSDMLEFYLKKLASNGQIVTDRLGLGWVPDDTNPRWSFDFDDLAAVGAAAGLSAFRMNRSVYVLARSAPAAPDVRSLSINLLRRTGMLPAQIARNGPRMLERHARKWIKWALASTIPWALPTRSRRDEGPDR